MKKVIVVYNPASNPIRFPADNKVFYVPGDTVMGASKIEEKVKDWAKKKGAIILRIDTVIINSDEIILEQPGPML